MISVAMIGNSTNEPVYEFYGLSTDEKPTDYNDCSIANGSTFIEVDTGTTYYFDAENETWIQSGSGSGGGGGNYAPLNSPAFTGVPTAPTAEAGTSTAQLATTAFVQNAVSDTQQAVDADIAALQTGLAAEITARTNADTTLQTSMTSANTAIRDLQTDQDVLEARMDEFASLPDGSTAGDAELLDIRVGADGTTYSSAGNAVRGQVTDLKSHLDVVNPATELSWTLKKSINANGVITDSNYTALTDFVRKCGKVTIVRKSPQKDSSNYALSFMVSQFNGDTFISRTNLTYPGNSITLEANCTKYAIAFGRSSGSGVQIQQSDIDTYFDADIYNEADSFKYGFIPADTTSLASLTVPGCYRFNLGNYANLTDLPANFETNRIATLYCFAETQEWILQTLIEADVGNVWSRRVNPTTGVVGNWNSLHATHYLAQAGGDADDLSWNGWYGWGSTESVTNVPTGVAAGMLCNVVRLANTKYQLAFDYATGTMYARNSKNSVWTDWKKLAFTSDVPKSGKTLHIKHESGSFADGAATERLHVYVPAETGYILYLMYHFVDTSNNSDVWQIYNAYQVDDSFDYANRKTLTITGEWECALHLEGRDDFSGGHTHGDEMMQSVAILMDGVPVTISDFTALTSCNDLRIIRTSTMYDPADHTTEIADHGVEYVFTTDGVSIDQSLKWLVAESLTNCFMCMFLPSKNYIDRASANSDFDLLTLPSETGSPLTTITKPHSTAVTMWDTASGMFAEVSVPIYPTGLTGGDKMTIHDNNNKAYNKVYFYVCTGGISAVGDLWKSKSIYKIGFKSAT